MAQFDVSDTRATLKRRPPISVSSVCLVLRDEVDELDNSAILDFGVRFTVALNCQNTSQNACYGCEKRKKKYIYIFFKSNQIRVFFDRRKFRRQCVNVINIT